MPKWTKLILKEILTPTSMLSLIEGHNKGGGFGKFSENKLIMEGAIRHLGESEDSRGSFHERVNWRSPTNCNNQGGNVSRSVTPSKFCRNNSK